MKSTTFFASLVILSIARVATAADPSADVKNSWPQWRGPLATGVAPDADPPTEWSEAKNVKWKVKIPGEGSSTPIVWGDKVFILSALKTEKTAGKKTAATENFRGNPAPYGDGTNSEVKTPPTENPPPREESPAGGSGGFRRGGGPGGPGGNRGGRMRAEAPSEVYQFVVLCIDRNTGKTLWQKVAREEVPHEGHHKDHGFASASPVTDGQLVFAYFGSRGLHCYDMDGNLKWLKDFGKMQTKFSFGEGASPALHGDRVIVNWDDETENDFIAAFDKKTGEELWKTPRSEGTGWATPLVVEHNRKFQAVINATGKVRSYDLADGKEIWSCGGQTANAIPSPVADANTVYVTSGFRGAAIFAFALGKTGDLAGTDAVRWSYNKNTPYVPSPLLSDGLIYVLKNNDGILTCFDAKDGNKKFEAARLEGISSVYASPVAAKDRVYVLSRDGVCVVLKKGTAEILATNKLGEHTDASPALVGREIFIRGAENLYCIAEK